MKKTGLEELEQFTMTRGEYAKELDITPNAVRMRMRTGKLSGEYRFNLKPEASNTNCHTIDSCIILYNLLIPAGFNNRY